MVRGTIDQSVTRQKMEHDGSFQAAVTVTGPVQNRGHLKISEHKMSRFSVRKEVIENNNSLAVISLSNVDENEFLQTL